MINTYRLFFFSLSEHFSESDLEVTLSTINTIPNKNSKMFIIMFILEKLKIFFKNILKKYLNISKVKYF